MSKCSILRSFLEEIIIILLNIRKEDVVVNPKLTHAFIWPRPYLRGK